MSLLMKQLAEALRALAIDHGVINHDGRLESTEGTRRGANADAARAALYAYRTQEQDLDAAALIVHAYARGEANGGSTDWDDLNQAYARACMELGKERVSDIIDLYNEDDDDGT